MLRREESVEGFLGELGDRLRPQVETAYLQAILSETEAHLRQAIDEMAALGVTPEEAERAAVAAYGRPEFQEGTPKGTVIGMGLVLMLASLVALRALEDTGSSFVRPWWAYSVGVAFSLLGVFALGLRGARPSYRVLGRPIILAIVAMALVLPFRFTVASNQWELQPVLFLPWRRDLMAESLRMDLDPKSEWSIPAFEDRLRQIETLRVAAAPHFGPQEPFSPYRDSLIPMPSKEARVAWKRRGVEVSRIQREALDNAHRQHRLSAEVLAMPYVMRCLRLATWPFAMALFWGPFAAASLALGRRIRRMTRRKGAIRA